MSAGVCTPSGAWGCICLSAAFWRPAAHFARASLPHSFAWVWWLRCGRIFAAACRAFRRFSKPPGICGRRFWWWPSFIWAESCIGEGSIPATTSPAYFYFCEKLLSVGSFDEPFSWRRLASLGGHTLLQCSVASRTSMASAQGFELAICPLILLGLIVGFRRGMVARTPFGVCVALAALTTPIIRVNSASHLTGVVLFLGLFVTLDLIDLLENSDQRSRLRWLAVAAMIAASACTLRAQYVPAAVGALGLFWLGSWIRDRRPRRDMMVEMACIGGELLLSRWCRG